MLKQSALITVFILLLTSTASAHHGWRWTTGNNIQLTGVITEAKLGNPHGVLKVQVEDDVWTIEVGQPWRNERAGIKDGDFAPVLKSRSRANPQRILVSDC